MNAQTMKKRNIILVAVWALFTLGIYGLYWLYATRKELIEQNKNPKSIPRVLWLVAPILALLVFALLLPLSSLLNLNDNAVLLIIMNLVGVASVFALLVLPFWWFYYYFKTVHEVTTGTDFATLYVIWIVLYILALWPAIMIVVQNDLNKFIDENGQPPQPHLAAQAT